MRNKIKYEEKRNQREKEENREKLKKEKIKEKEDLMLKFGILFEYNNPEVMQKAKRKIGTSSRRFRRRRERIEDLRNLSKNNKRIDKNKRYTKNENSLDYIE